MRLVPTYELMFIWSPAHTLTETMDVTDKLNIAGPLMIADLVDWMTLNMGKFTGWNGATQVVQVINLLESLKAVPDPINPISGQIKDFMEWDRRDLKYEDYMPNATKIVINKYSGSKFTDIKLPITIAQKWVEIHLHIIQKKECWAVP